MKIQLRLSFVVIVLLLALCACKRKVPELALLHQKESPQENQVSFQTPPSDYSAWAKEHGATEPDPASDEGRKRLQNEKKRLGASRSEFVKVLKELGNAYTNSSEKAFRDCLLRMDEILDDFSRECSAAILGVAEKNPGLIIPSRDLFVSQERATRIIDRYTVVAGRLADLTWAKGGEAFAAAEIDNLTFKVLKGIDRLSERNGWREAQEEARLWFDRYAQSRCDSEASNFCRSHEACELRYHSCFEKLVQKDPRLMKPLSHWYRRHLNCARSILGREPKWSPDYREVEQPKAAAEK